MWAYGARWPFDADKQLTTGGVHGSAFKHSMAFNSGAQTQRHDQPGHWQPHLLSAGMTVTATEAPGLRR